MRVYFISGLGADNRIFKYLHLPVSVTPVYLDWLIPEKKESIEHYAKRMAEMIDASQPFILIGLSFGGIIATEITEFLKPEKTILISSVASCKEMPSMYRLAGSLGLNKLIPPKTANQANAISYWMFGITEKRDKALLKEILSDTNTAFSKWAVNALLNWKRKAAPEGLIRIHGDKDRVLPIHGFTPDHTIKRGGHFMIVNKAEEISEILSQLLK